MSETVIIAGGGIGGLTMALTLHQIGVPCTVIEAVEEMRRRHQHPTQCGTRTIRPRH